MRASAPGKLVLTGAYAVLEGAPAVVVAVDRRAVADASLADASPAAEVRAAFAETTSEPPRCDVSALVHDGQKLGLGSSAAAVVAAIGAARVRDGADLDDASVRADVFRRARAAHAAVQGGGSGVDVAASTYGGVLRYTLIAGGTPSMVHLTWPERLVLRTFFSGASARTSDLRARVDAFRTTSPTGHARAMGDLGAAAEDAAALFEGGSASEIVLAVRAFGEALERLADAADVPIVPVAFRRLASAAAEGGAGWFLPSGAGGGDVGVYVGVAPPSEAFTSLADRLGMLHLPIGIDPHGVRVH